MSQHLLKSPDTVSVTATSRKVTLLETSCWHSIRNAGTADVYYIAQPEDEYTSSTYDSVTAAALRTANCSMVRAGDSTAFYTDIPHIYLVCASGLTATVNIEAGIISGSPEVTVNTADIEALLRLTPVNEAAVELSVTTSNQTATVVDEDTAMYILTAVDGIIYAGFNDTVNTATNRAWVIPAGQSRLISMPSAETTLNYIGDVACTGYLQKVTNT